MSDLVDAVVVGGGLLGTAMTLALARRNLRVILLESQRLGKGATGSGFAWINATYKTEDETYFQLNAQGVACYDQLAREWGAERAGIHTTGSVFWTRPEDSTGQERLRQQAQRLQEWNYPVTLLSGAELAVLEPNVASYASQSQTMDANAVLFAPNDKWVDTSRLCRLFVEQAQLHKAEIRLDCPALGFTRNASNAISTVDTALGRISTPLLVLAAGIATPQLVAQLTGDPTSAERVPVNQEPGLLLETPPLPFSQNIGRILYPPDAQGLHLRPTPSGGVLIGAENIDADLQRAALSRSTPNINAASISNTNSNIYSNSISEAVWRGLLDRAASGLLDRAAKCLPDLPLSEMAAGCIPRLCIRPVPADGFPIVGALDEVPGAYVIVTHSGITLGPLLADLLATEILTRTASPLLTRYRPDRFSAL